MTLEHFIDPNIPIVKPTDTINKVLELAEENYCTHLPVVTAQGVFVGFAVAPFLETLPNTDAPLNEIKLTDEKQILPQENHYVDALMLANEGNNPFLAISNQGKYAGVVSYSLIARKLGKGLGLAGQGGIIVLQMSANDYSLSEISRLSESDNIKIMASFCEIHPNDPYALLVTLKLATNQLQRTISTYERFGYQVVGSFNVTDQGLQHTDRVGFLMRYLEI